MEGFKETEFGKIPLDWELKYIDEIKSEDKNAISMGPFGSNIKKENFIESGVPVIRGNNLNEYRFLDSEFVYVNDEKADQLRSSNSLPGDIVITHRGTLGQVGIIPEKSNHNRYIVSQSGMKLRCDKNKANNYFIFYFLKSANGQNMLLRNTSQTGVPAIALPLTSLKKIPIPIPAIEEQRAIAKILSDLDEKIEINKKINYNLEELGQALFKKWFVDFNFPNDDDEPYQSSGGEMIESELGLIPKDWKIEKIENIVITNRRGLVPKYVDEGIPIINQRCIRGYKVIEEAVQNHNPNEKYSEEYILKPYDILINSMGTGTLGRVSQVVLVKETKLIHNCITIIRANEEIINPLILGYFFKSIQNKLELMGEGSTGQQSLKNKYIDEIKYIVPSIQIQNKISKTFYYINIKIEENLFQIKVLENIRDSLLPKLMSGQIRV